MDSMSASETAIPKAARFRSVEMAKKKLAAAGEFKTVKTVPGLGCSSPGCKSAFYTTQERFEHIRSKHPGEYAGPTEDMHQFAQMAGNPDLLKVDIFHDRRGE